MSENANWYYIINGDQVGPVDFDGIKALIITGKISLETKVWRGEGDWVEARETELAKFSPAPKSPTGSINNTFIWILAVSPLLISLLALFAGAPDLVGLTIFVNVGLGYLDEKKLKKAGWDAPASGWVWLIPVYVWKRANLLKQKKSYFWTWIIALVLSCFVDIGTEQIAIEESSVPVVNEILVSEIGSDAAQCIAVTIEETTYTDSVSYHQATALLDNGNSLKIMIVDPDDSDEIEVRIIDVN